MLVSCMGASDIGILERRDRLLSFCTREFSALDGLHSFLDLRSLASQPALRYSMSTSRKRFNSSSSTSQSTKKKSKFRVVEPDTHVQHIDHLDISTTAHGRKSVKKHRTTVLVEPDDILSSGDRLEEDVAAVLDELPVEEAEQVHPAGHKRHFRPELRAAVRPTWLSARSFIDLFHTVGQGSRMAPVPRRILG